MKTVKKTFLFSTAFLSLLGLSLPGAVGLLTAGGCGNASTGAVAANAGADQEVLLSSLATLDGNGSTGVLNASWALTSQPTGSTATLSNASTLTPTLTPDVAGDYVAELSVNGGAATDSVTIAAKVAIATITVPDGSAITTRERFGVTEYVIDLEATGATLSSAGSAVSGLTAAALETKNAAAVTYTWEQISGPGATAVGDMTGTTFEFTAPGLVDIMNLSASDRYKWQPLRVSRNDTKMIFRLTISSADGSSSDSATIAVYVQDDGSEIHTSSGLLNVGVGTRVYLSGPNLDASGASAMVPANENGDPITDWAWTLTTRPAGSSATFIDSGTNASVLEFPSFIPDVPGVYVVDFNSTTGNTSGSAYATNKVPGSLTFSAGDFVGVGTVGGTSPRTLQCAICHDGIPLGVDDDMVSEWNETKHADMFENSMSLYKALAPEPYLWEFHTVGYNKDANDDGFDDLASAVGFTFPETGLTFSEFVAAYPSVAKLANIQCENCHGPGGQHGGDPVGIAFSFAQYGVCGQCHVEEEQWMNSAHNSTGVAHGSGGYQGYWVTNAGCVRCHNAMGFESWLAEGEEGLGSMVGDAGAFPGVTCAACHDPHDATNPLQLRLYGDVTMAIDGSTVSVGEAAVCYNCHDGNYALHETDCDSDGDGRADATCADADQTAGEYWRGGYHYGTQSTTLEGNQALRDLAKGGAKEGAFVISFTENSFHSDPTFTLAGVTGNPDLPSVNNKCVTCHMATGPSNEEEGYLHLGGHAFKLRTAHGLGHLLGGEGAEEEETEEAAGELELITACTVCHTSLTEMNRTARADYDGDGTIEGIQDEIRGLLVNLGTLIRSLDTDNINQTSGFIVTDGVLTENSLNWAGTKSSGLTATNNCAIGAPPGGREAYQPCNFVDADPILRRAVWNYNSVVRDGSLGIHNAAYAIQILQKTYQALGFLLQGKTVAQAAYNTAYPNATLR